MHDGNSKNSWYPSPNSHWKHWKNIYLKLELPDWCNFCKNIIQWYFPDLWSNIPFYSENLCCIVLTNIPKDTKSFLTWLLHVASNSAGYYKNISRKDFPATTRVWSRISYGDEWTSSQVSNHFLPFFQAKQFFFSTSWKYRRLPIWFKTLKVQSFKLYNNKYMIASTQVTNPEIFTFVAVLGTVDK